MRYRTFQVTPQQLLELLGVDPLQAVNDAEAVARYRNVIRPEALAKSRWMSSTPQFKNWVSDQQFSRLLLVDGFCAEDGVGRNSPLSVFCASLAAMISQLQSTWSSTFTAADSARSNDPAAGPAGLARSLISQLDPPSWKAYPDLGFRGRGAVRSCLEPGYRRPLIPVRADRLQDGSHAGRYIASWTTSATSERSTFDLELEDTEQEVRDLGWAAQLQEVFSSFAASSTIDDQGRPSRSS